MEELKISFETFGSRVEFGWGTLNTLTGHVKSFGSKNPLIVTDEGFVATGIPEKVVNLLRKEGLGAVTFKGVSPNPTDKDVQKGVAAYKKESCDLIIGLGGGSPMDAAKGVRVLATHKEPLKQYLGLEGAKNIVQSMPPLIAIPTTSGTGSEVSRGAVITDTERNVKCVLRAGMPNLAIVDPELTLGLPPYLTAATGMDALSHNIEAFLSPKYHPVAEAIAYEGMRLVAENLLSAVADGRNRLARIHLAMASVMGALAFQKGLGMTHSLAHQLSTEFGAQHGAANALLLPHTMQFNRQAAEEKLKRIALAMGERSPSADAAIQAVARLSQKAGLPTKLSEAKVLESSIPKMARNAMDDWCHPSNPRPCTEADMALVLKKAF